MNKMLFNTIITQLRKKVANKQLCIESTDRVNGLGSIRSDSENYVVYSPLNDDFYFIADKGTIPPNENQTFIYNGVRLRVNKRMVVIGKLPF